MEHFHPRRLLLLLLRPRPALHGRDSSSRWRRYRCCQSVKTELRQEKEAAAEALAGREAAIDFVVEKWFLKRCGGLHGMY